MPIPVGDIVSVRSDSPVTDAIDDQIDENGVEVPADEDLDSNNRIGLYNPQVIRAIRDTTRRHETENRRRQREVGELQSRIEVLEAHSEALRKKSADSERACAELVESCRGWKEAHQQKANEYDRLYYDDIVNENAYLRLQKTNQELYEDKVAQECANKRLLVLNRYLVEPRRP